MGRERISEATASGVGDREPKQVVAMPWWIDGDQLILKCSCGCSFVNVVEWDAEEDEPKQWTVDFSETYHGTTLRQRFKNAIHAFQNKWGGGHSSVWEIEQVMAVSDFLAGQIEKANEIRPEGHPIKERGPHA